MGPQIERWHVFTLLALFWLAWLYTEIVEKLERDSFVEEVDSFINQGGRFTAERGYNLCVRIRHLETMHHGIDVPLCEKPDDQQTNNGQ